EGNDARKFITKLEESTQGATGFHLLTEGIRSAYESGIQSRKRNPKLRLISEVAANGASAVAVALFETDARSFLENPGLAEEIFGPSTLLIQHSKREQVVEIARALEGHLTATIHGTKRDLEEFSDLIAILETKVGRLILNGFPTGVEVSHAMVHGGPF